MVIPCYVLPYNTGWQSVETLYGAPKGNAYGEEKVQTTNNIVPMLAMKIVVVRKSPGHWP